MRHMIEGYRIYPGEHCGSASMRGLLEHYCGLELPEPAVFGLGAGLGAMFIDSDFMDPPKAIFGRTATLEVDLGRNLGLDYREATVDDDDDAWQIARDEVLAGRPTMLTGDILYLDYREYKVHFPSHRFVLLGFDDETEKAFIADRIRDVPEACSYGALRTSRNPPEGMSTYNLWGRFHGTELGYDLPESAARALSMCAEQMLGLAPAEPPPGPDDKPSFANAPGVHGGIEAIVAFAEDLPGWGDHPKSAWLASFNARAIEKFGNGGGNFRRLYAGFLEWARALDEKLVPETAPGLAWEAADGWTAISAELAQVSEEGAPDGVWDRASKIASRVAGIERRLFEQIADHAPATAS